MPPTTTAFDFPERLAAKADPALIAGDEAHFAAVAQTLQDQTADLVVRLDELRKSPGGTGRAAMDRDLEIHRLTGQLRLLRRYGLDLCLGRMVSSQEPGSPDPPETVYVGRFGLVDRTGRRLLVDWRAPAAEPFFGATHARPMGLASRRRYRWTHGRISDYWDEVFASDGLEGHAALDDQSAFLASLGSSRSPRMRDVLSTIQADQDAIIRAGSRGALVIEGGPGTGKTVVALHRAAYLLYADPRLGEGRGGVLFVGPHRPYLAYIADILPGLGEDGVQTCTLRDLVAEGATATEESDPEVARLKSSAAMVGAVEPAVRLYEEPPGKGMLVETDVVDVWLTAEEWIEAFSSPDPGTPHNEALDQVRDALVTILVDKITDKLPTPDADSDDDLEEDTDEDTDDLTPELLDRSLRRNAELTDALDRAWTLIEAADLVGDLWSVPAYLRRCAPWLSPEDVRRLQRRDPQAWTVADLPLLDAARLRLGDPEESRRRRRRAAVVAAERAAMDQVVDDLLAADDDPEGSTQLLRRQSIRDSLVDEAGAPSADPDRLAGPFAHVVVDEAQELTDAEWQMLLRRCPSRSFTIVGDRAQARHGFVESWAERLERVGFDSVAQASLTINYRTPDEVMTAAEPVIRAVFPDANVPTSVRRSGVPVGYGPLADLDVVLASWLEDHGEGIACVISTREGPESYEATARVRTLRPEHAKGLEFDLVVLVDPDGFGRGEPGIEGTVDRYVAMTRATQQLVVLTTDGRRAR